MRDVTPANPDCGTHTVAPHDLSADRRRWARVDVTRFARFDPDAHLIPPGPCGQSLVTGDACRRWCFGASTRTESGHYVFTRDCGGLHLSDVQRFRDPGRWRPWSRRRATIALAAVPDAREWPIIEVPETHDVDRWLAQEVLSLPTDQDCTDQTAEMLFRLLQEAECPLTTEVDEGDQVGRWCRSTWYSHSGTTSVSSAGGIRLAASELFPHAAAPRSSDAAVADQDELVPFLENHSLKARQYLATLGIASLTLYRGVHGTALDWEHPDPITATVRDAVRTGTLKGTSDDTVRWQHVNGSFAAPPVTSTVDGWSTLRDHAAYWSKGSRSGVRSIMVAEVPAWAVLSWGALGIGDRWRRGEEVLVLGGQGTVRWEVEGDLVMDETS